MPHALFAIKKTKTFFQLKRQKILMFEVENYEINKLGEFPSA